MDCSLKTGFGNVQVVPHIGQLLLQGDKRLVDREGLPEIAGQRQDRLLSPLWAGTAQSGDGAQGVEEEMRVDLRLQGPQLGLLAKLDLELEFSQLQHGGKHLRQTFRDAAVCFQDQVWPLGDTENERPHDLPPPGQRGGDHRPIRAAGLTAAPFHHQFPLFNGSSGRRKQRGIVQPHAADRHHLFQTGERHLKLRQYLLHRVHRFLHCSTVLHPLPEKGKALLGDKKRQILLLRQLDGHATVQAAQQPHKQDKPQRIDYNFRKQDDLFQIDRSGKGF